MVIVAKVESVYPGWSIDINSLDPRSLVATESLSPACATKAQVSMALAGGITSMERLRQHLQWAIELEHSTIPPYLCALYSIEAGHNAEDVEVLSSVVVEEMLHLTLAANLLNDVGGRPRLDVPEMLPGYRQPLPHGDHSFDISLYRFSPEAIETFL